MPTFKEKYELMFGKQPAFDPINIDADDVDTRADDLLASAPTASPSQNRSALPFTPLQETKTSGDSGFLENVGRQFGAGAVQVGEMGLGAAEYVARQNEFLDGIVADTIYSGRSGLANVREDILAGIDEEARQKAAAEILTLDPNRTIWQGNPLDRGRHLQDRQRAARYTRHDDPCHPACEGRLVRQGDHGDGCDRRHHVCRWNPERYRR